MTQGSSALVRARFLFTRFLKVRQLSVKKFSMCSQNEFSHTIKKCCKTTDFLLVESQKDPDLSYPNSCKRSSPNFASNIKRTSANNLT